MAVDSTTGGEESNSYVSLAEADIYHAARGNAAWAEASEDAQSSALIRACDYIEATYGGKFSGTIATATQRLSWPRNHTTDANGRSIPDTIIPQGVREAQCELALVALGRADLTPRIDDAGVKRQRQKVGQIETEIEYVDAGSTAYRAVTARLAPFITHVSTLLRS